MKLSLCKPIITSISTLVISGNDAVVVGNAASEYAVCGDEAAFGDKTVTL